MKTKYWPLISLFTGFVLGIFGVALGLSIQSSAWLVLAPTLAFAAFSLFIVMITGLALGTHWVFEKLTEGKEVRL